MEVYLNGNKYVLIPGGEVKRTPLVEWPDNIRLDGQQQRKDRQLISSYVIDSWINGLGIEEQNANIPSHNYRLWDVENCDTRFPNQIVKSPAFNTCTIVPSRGDLKLSLDHQNNLYFIETARGVPSIDAAYAYKFTGPLSVASSNVLARRAGMQIGSVTAVYTNQDEILFIGKNQNTGTNWMPESIIKVQSLGATPTTLLEGVNISTTVRPRITDMGGTAHVLTWKSNVAYFFVVDQELSTVTEVGSFNSYVGSYLSSLVSDGLTVYANLPEGIYDFDITPAIAIDNSNSKDRNCSQVMFQNELYFKNKYSLVKYDGTDLESVGYDDEDGLPSREWGQITAMTSTWKCIFTAIKGATYSHILTMDSDKKWQYFARIPSPNLWVSDMFLSNSPDSIDRLWCVYGNYGYPGYFLNPLVNPLQAGTYAYVPTGEFSPPIYDGGLSEIPGGMYDIAVTADGMGGSHIITVYYGINGNSPVTTLGVIATTYDTLKFGSPYGLDFYRVQPRFILGGTQTGTTPVFREAIIHYLKDPNKRYLYEFEVDIEETMKREIRPPEAVYGSLAYEVDKKTLMPFWYGRIGTKAVKVIDAPSIEDVELQRDFQGEREGSIKLVVAEIL
jgi:hypothetical protein